jgi:uncharacterized YccA/Bax inhibitor family protein
VTLETPEALLLIVEGALAVVLVLLLIVLVLAEEESLFEGATAVLLEVEEVGPLIVAFDLLFVRVALPAIFFLTVPFFSTYDYTSSFRSFNG